MSVFSLRVCCVDVAAHLFLLEDGLLLQHFDSVKLVVRAVARQQHLAEASLADHFEEVEVTGLGGWVGGRAQVDLLGRAGLEGGERGREERRGNRVSSYRSCGDRTTRSACVDVNTREDSIAIC